MDHESIANEDAPSVTSPLRDMSTRQRAGLGVAALIVVLGLTWGLWSRGNGDLVPLPTVEALTPATAREFRKCLRDAGLTDFRVSGDQILVPRSRLDRYTAVLPSAPPATDNWAAEWERQNERLTPFSSSGDREATREIARAKLIAGMLRQLPDIEDADVVWDEDEQPGWRQSPKTRATVYLRPRPDCVLTLDVIRSVRLAVAGSKKNLDPADVVVMDLARQITYEGELPATIGEDLLPALRSLAEVYRREIRQHVPVLETADVVVSIDWPRFLAFITDYPSDAATRLSAMAPNLLRVNVIVPDDSVLPTDTSMAATRQWQEEIATLTGIGRDAAHRDDQILVQFIHPDPTKTVPASPVAGLALSSPRGQLVAGGLSIFALLMVTMKLRRCPSHRRRASAAADVPTFHAVNQTSQILSTPHGLNDFDDIARLDGESLRAAYSHATPRRWAVALRGSARETRSVLAAALAAPAAMELHQQCEQLGPVTLGDIESSRQRILASARSLHVSTS